jgi:hypothetical protein
MLLEALTTVPMPGKVPFTSDGRTVSTRTDAEGRFAVRLSEGVYKITGRSPDYQAGTWLCSGGTVKVTANSLRTVTVVCQGM